MKEFFAEWGGVIGYVGPPLVGWLWWSVRQRFTPKEEHSVLVARVARLESDIEDMPDGQTMLKIQLALEELRGDSKRQDAKIDGVQTSVDAMRTNLDMLIQHHLSEGKS